jgi:uncharacterized protein
MAASSMTGDGSQSRGRGAQLLALSCVAVFALLVSGAIAITVFGSRQPGEPVVQLALQMKHLARVKPRTPPPVAPPAQSPVTETTSPATAPGTAPATPPAASATPPAAAPAPEAAPIGRVTIADPALIEKTPQGPLPKIGLDGTAPLRAYAMPVPTDGKPRVAIVIDGLGISARATQAALDGLPRGVTLAFAPYANDVQRWVTLARQKGHEVLLEVPMEPYDFPDSDPGQYTLRVGAGEDANTKRLVWALTRFTGYVGVTNLLGGRLLSEGGALEPVLAYLTRRGLMFYDNGAAAHSVAPVVAARTGAPFVQATDTIDSIQAAMEIDHRLSDLEALARTKGSASGTGFLYPVTIDRVNVWARGLGSRGLVLVPISALVSAPKK